VETEPFDLIVLDMALPGSSGIAILEQIRSARPETPVIVLSDGDDPDARPVYEVAGASVVIARPLVVETLRTSVNDELGRRRGW
jgi:two-component system OmpR family response regulator